MKNIHKHQTPRGISLDLESQIKSLFSTSTVHIKHLTWGQEELKALFPSLELEKVPLSFFKPETPTKTSKLKLTKSRNNSDKKIFHQLDVEETLKSSVTIPKSSEAFIQKLGLSKPKPPEIDPISTKGTRKTLLRASKSTRESTGKISPTKIFPNRRAKKTKTVVSKNVVTHKQNA